MTAHPGRAHLTLAELREEPSTISVERAGRYIGVSRSYSYQLVREGRLPTIRLGARRVRIPTAALLRILTGDSSAI